MENSLPTETGSDRQSNEAEGRSKGPLEDAPELKTCQKMAVCSRIQGRLELPSERDQKKRC